MTLKIVRRRGKLINIEAKGIINRAYRSLRATLCTLQEVYENDIENCRERSKSVH